VGLLSFGPGIFAIGYTVGTESVTPMTVSRRAIFRLMA